MRDELLNRATRALQGSTKPHRDGMEEMLVRVSRRRPTGIGARSRLRAVVYALAATFVGVGAWAQASGRLDSVLGRVTPREQALRVLPPALTVVTPAPTTRAAAPAPQHAVAEPGLVALPTPLSAAQRAEPKPARSVFAPPSARSQAQALPSATPTVPPNVDQLYREAHRAHFGSADANEAVAAWDRYLAVAGPEARMLIEARYNRATALARAGRVSQAVTALLPFADGAYGNYRREEALALIESLSRAR